HRVHRRRRICGSHAQVAAAAQKDSAGESQAEALGKGGRERGARRRGRQYSPINLQQKFGLFAEQWQPKVIAEMNDYQFKVVKLRGDFVWHDHKDTDETFLVIEGTLRIDFRDGAVHIGPGEMFVV